MTQLAYRYPGASPFGDNPISQLTYFGRQRELSALLSKVLANRLTLVYARSGLGKTSLLRAGLSPALRAADYFPAFIRVEADGLDPFGSIAAQISAEATRHGIEQERSASAANVASYLDGTFFWRGDRLQTPVLIFDQFEEVFTLVQKAQRDDWIDEIAWLLTRQLN